ncbi:Reverse transcriptase, partial [Trichuris trichiura]
KIALIRENLIPRCIYQLSHLSPQSTLASQVDQIIRQTVKQNLHLPATAITGPFLHLPTQHGGLGLPSLINVTRIKTLWSFLKLSYSPRPLMRTVFEHPISQRAIAALKSQLGVQALTFKTLNAAKRRLAKQLEEQLHKTNQGRRLAFFISSKESNACLVGRLMTGHAFIRLIQLRTNTVPTRMALLRGSLKLASEQTKCRHCGSDTGRFETLAHAVQQCRTTHALRVIRHNTLVSRFKEADLILRRGQRLSIIHMAVPWDSPERFAASRAYKRSKYAVLEP